VTINNAVLKIKGNTDLRAEASASAVPQNAAFASRPGQGGYPPQQHRHSAIM
jgi:hypothetical protein